MVSVCLSAYVTRMVHCALLYDKLLFTFSNGIFSRGPRQGPAPRIVRGGFVHYRRRREGGRRRGRDGGVLEVNAARSLPVHRAEIDRINSGSELLSAKRDLSTLSFGGGETTQRVFTTVSAIFQPPTPPGPAAPRVCHSAPSPEPGGTCKSY